MAVANRNKNDSARNDWCTPPFITDAILKLMECGMFNMDVCCTKPNIPAYFHLTENGCLEHPLCCYDSLNTDWSGMCFMNPPYADLIKKFVKKAYDEVEKSNGFTSVWAILPSRTENGYYHDLIFNNPNCFFVLLRGGIGMINPDTKEQTPASNKYILVYFTKQAEMWYNRWNELKPLKGKAVLGG